MSPSGRVLGKAPVGPIIRSDRGTAEAHSKRRSRPGEPSPVRGRGKSVREFSTPPPTGLGPPSSQGTLMLLRTEGLTKRYGSFTAVDRLDLEVAPGEVVGLLGPNGSGKSTALRMLLGFLRPSAGRAAVGGHDCWHDSVAARRLV